MGDVLTDTDDKTTFRAGRILLGVLALLSAICIISGGFFYAWIVADYLQDDSPFVGLQKLGWVFGLFSACVISIGLLLAGMLFRLMPRPRAPRASLCLAIAALAFLIVTYMVFSDLGDDSDRVEIVGLQGACVLYLFLIALPPFLHWWKAKPRSVMTRTPPH